MKLVLRGFGLLFALALVWVAVQMIASESREVVVLTTTNQDAEDQETRLWVVEHEGRAWLRSGADIQSWYQNIAERPDVDVLRGDERKPYTAVPVLESREVINRLMQDKYGWADRYIGFFFSRDSSIPIRLDPR